MKSSNHCRAVEAASLCEASFQRDPHDNIHGTNGKAFRALSELRFANSTKSITAGVSDKLQFVAAFRLARFRRPRQTEGCLTVSVPRCSRVQLARLAFWFDGCAALPLHIFDTTPAIAAYRLQATNAEWEPLCARRSADTSPLRWPASQETNISVWQKN